MERRTVGRRHKSAPITASQRPAHQSGRRVRLARVTASPGFAGEKIKRTSHAPTRRSRTKEEPRESAFVHPRPIDTPLGPERAKRAIFLVARRPSGVCKRFSARVGPLAEPAVKRNYISALESVPRAQLLTHRLPGPTTTQQQKRRLFARSRGIPPVFFFIFKASRHEPGPIDAR